MTIQDIEKINKPFLIASDIHEFLGVDPHSIRCQAWEDPKKLGFPVIVCGRRLLIPKDGFIRFYKGAE